MDGKAMLDKNLFYTPARELARMIADKDLSPVELVDAVLARAETLQSTLNAFITLAPEQALAAAKTAEAAVLRGDPLGPFHGIPFSVKDLLNTAGVRTTFASHAFADNIPTADCIAVARLKAAGAIMIGKTTTPEFGHKPLTEAPIFGRTLNPWDLTRTPGGSSGGAAAAVAAGIAPLAVGTDGGGSIRIPAAACGIVGMKQTLGRVPHDQTPDVFGLLAYIGPMTRDVGDAAAMLEVMSGPDASDPHSLGHDPLRVGDALAFKGRRIGWRRFLGNRIIDPETSAHFDRALAVVTDLGAELVPLEDDFPDTLPIWAPLTFSIWAARFGQHAEALGERMSETLRIWIAEGDKATAIEVQEAMAVRTRLYRQVEGWFNDVDLVLTPTLAREALAADHDPFGPVIIDNQDAGGLRDGWYPYTHPFNLTGHPALTIPAGWTEAGLPTGLQIVGPYLGDARILEAALTLEEAMPWADRRPN